jgi:MoxR-like ATPase
LTSLERDRVPSARPIAAKEIPLVDRTEEMNVLKEAVYRAVLGEGGLVFIHGEAGIGKTRLVRELGAYARSRSRDVKQISHVNLSTNIIGFCVLIAYGRTTDSITS